MKILLCFGTRPEAIKMAPLCYGLKKEGIPFKICVTGQHRDLLDQVLSFFELIPDYDFNLMEENQNLNMLSANILKHMNKVLVDEHFDLVMVHGDTTSSSTVALAAFYNNVKVAHVEAGLRTYNKQAPFPEEINRQLIGKIADYHFPPTKQAFLNLQQEGVPKNAMVVTGNTIVDALEITDSILNSGYKNKSIESLKQKINFKNQVVLVTGHRRESYGAGFKALCNALLELSENKNLQIVFPVHLNPNVQNVVYKVLSNKSNIHLIDPLDYPSFIWLIKKSTLIISDSGGIQEEAPSFNVPVLVTREVTERNEGILAGCSFLVGTEENKIVEKALEILNEKKPKKYINPYGDGKATTLIINFIKEITNERE